MDEADDIPILSSVNVVVEACHIADVYEAESKHERLIVWPQRVSLAFYSGLYIRNGTDHSSWP